MSIESFYSNPDLEDGFGATEGRVRPHRGVDFPHPEGTPVPALYSGKVVLSEYDPGLGHILEVEHDRGVWIGYGHFVRAGLKVGTSVLAGDTLGYVGNTGTQSNGNHSHITKSNRKGGIFGASMEPLSDPWPYIKEAIKHHSGGTAGGWAFNPPAAAVQAQIQKALKARNRYSGPVDGVWGSNSVKGIQTTIRNVGYTGKVDGIAGPDTCYYVQKYAQKFGDYKGPLDRVLGPNGWAGFALGLERP